MRPVTLLKETPKWMFSCGCYKTSNNTYFEEHQHTAVSQLTLGSDCLGFFSEQLLWKYFNLKILQKYQLLLNQSFKRNLAQMPCLNLTPPFERRFHMIIIRDDTHMTSIKINFPDLQPLSLDFRSLILNTPTPSSWLSSPTNYGTTTAAWM